MLYDAVEYQDVTNAEIVDLFGPTVASLVAELTDDKGLLKQERRRRVTQELGRVCHQSRRQDKQAARHRQQPAVAGG